MVLQTALLVLQFILLVQSTLPVTPASGAMNLADLEAQMDYNGDVEKVMNKLVLKHEEFLKRHANRVDAAKIQSELRSEEEPDAGFFRRSRQPRFTNEMRLHMIPIMKKDIRSIKQRLRRKYSEDIVNVLGAENDSDEDRQSVLLYYSNE